ncbi:MULTISPECIES: attachment protein [unclassified Pseudomonas]|uniref:attachment protein n=1 Tax=unclassified Pseudomonas TaxID=196821 RepID=UPI00111223FB|nr:MULTISPECIES: attachment protein [unclassified Pseudomonas]
MEPPRCDTGLDLLTRGSDFPATNVSGRVYILSSPPSSVCSAGCQYTSASSKASSCYLVSGSTDTGFCNYSMTSDGERCSGDAPPGPDVGDPPNPDDTSETPNQPSDPDDPGCSPGQAWSGSACVTEPTGEGDEGDGTDDGEGDDSGDPCDIEGDCWDEDDGGSGSGNGSGNGSGSGNGDDDGSDDGGGEDDGEGECDPSQGYVCGDGKGPESTLNTPDVGSWDKANEEWDQRLDEAKKELKDKVKANVDQMKNAFNLQISAGGGQLPCDSISVWGKSYRFCVADYGEQLINLRLALLLMAAVIAALIILKD